jgi:hypothetical protein
MRRRITRRIRRKWWRRRGVKDEEDAEDQRGWSLPPSTLYWLVIATRYQLAL